MERRSRKLLFALCGLMALVCFVSAFFMNVVPVKANGITTDIVMIPGAQVRKNDQLPGLRFTAKLNKMDIMAEYGMLILPEVAWDILDFNGDYHEVLGDRTYADGSCTPYEVEGDTYISLSIVGLLPQNYSMNFVGVAYKKSMTGVYSYAEVRLEDNARSMAYVAQMALKYDTELTETQVNYLEEYANPGVVVDREEYLDGFGDDNFMATGSAVIDDGDNVVAIDIQNKLSADNGRMSFITAEGYTNISKIIFDFKTGAQAGIGRETWWGFALTTNPAKASIYNYGESGTGHAKNFCILPYTDGEWTTVTVEFGENDAHYSCSNGASGGFEYLDIDKANYVYFVGARGENFDGPVYINNFRIICKNSQMFTDNFDTSAFGGMFRDYSGSNEPAVTLERNTTYSVIFEETEEDVTAENTNVLAIKGNTVGNVEKVAIVTKNSYSHVSKLTFDAQWTGAGISDQWGLSFTTDKGNFNCYWPKSNVTLKKDAGVWYTYEFTPYTDGNGNPKVNVFFKERGQAEFTKLGVGDWTNESSYFYIQIAPKGQENGHNGLLTDQAVLLIDNFVITSDVTEYDQFEVSPTAGLFNYGSGQSEGLTLVQGESDTKNKVASIIGKAIGGNEAISMITKNGYTGITSISFDALWTGAGESDRWGLSYKTASESYNHYVSPLGELKQYNSWVSYNFAIEGSTVTITYKPYGSTSWLSLGQ